MNRTENRMDNFCEERISNTYRWKQEPFSIIKFANDFNDDLFTIYFVNLVSFSTQRKREQTRSRNTNTIGHDYRSNKKDFFKYVFLCFR